MATYRQKSVEVEDLPDLISLEIQEEVSRNIEIIKNFITSAVQSMKETLEMEPWKTILEGRKQDGQE